MKRALALMLLGVAGCGGAGSAGSNADLIGVWTGTYSETVNSGPPKTTDGTLQIDDAGDGRITTGALCGGGPKVAWNATGSDSFSVGRSVWSVLSPDCGSPGLSVTGGTISLSQGTITYSVSYHSESCLPGGEGSTTSFTGTKSP